MRLSITEIEDEIIGLLGGALGAIHELHAKLCSEEADPEGTIDAGKAANLLDEAQKAVYALYTELDPSKGRG